MRKLLASIALAMSTWVPSVPTHAAVVLDQTQTFQEGNATARVGGVPSRSAPASADVNGFVAEAGAARSELFDGRPQEGAANARMNYAVPSGRSSLNTSASALAGTLLVQRAVAETRHSIRLQGTNGGADDLDLYLDLQFEGLVLNGAGSALSLADTFDLGISEGSGVVAERLNVAGVSYTCSSMQCVAGPQMRSVYLGRLPPANTFVRDFVWRSTASAEAGNTVDPTPIVRSAASSVILDRALLTLRGVEVVAVPAPTDTTALLAVCTGLALLTARRARR